jgi:hypothetical protein
VCNAQPWGRETSWATSTWSALSSHPPHSPPAVSIFLARTHPGLALSKHGASQLFKPRLTQNIAPIINKSLKHSPMYNVRMGRKIENPQAGKHGATKTQVDSTSSSTMPMKYTKNENGDFVCPDCGVVKKNQSTMFYHMKKHEEELNYVCKACKKGFLQKQTLDLHMRSKHPELVKDTNTTDKKFKCPFDNCEFSALTKGNCVIHCLRVHFQDEINEMMAKDNETKMIYCNECNKEFSSACAFYYHCKTCIDFNKNDEKYQTLQEIIA